MESERETGGKVNKPKRNLGSRAAEGPALLPYPHFSAIYRAERGAELTAGFPFKARLTVINAHRAAGRLFREAIAERMQALKQSLEKAKPKQKAAPAQRKRKTASSDS